MEVIQNLVNEAVWSMEEAGLSDGYIRSFSSTWQAFDDWLVERGAGYSPELGGSFLLEAYGIGRGGSTVSMERRRRRALAIIRNCHEHEPYRRVEDRKYESFFRECHEADLDEFLDELKKRYSDSTICAYVYVLNKLSPYLEERGINDIADIDAAAVMGFMQQVSESGVGQQLVYSTTSKLRRLLSWLESTGRIGPSAVDIVPKAKAPRPESPDTYTDEEVELIIGAIDTTSPTGKRNLVACLLAARLGMRSSDIVGLRFDNLSWKESCISFASAKTGQPTVLPLTNEIGTAIISYVKEGRPESSEPYVLVRHNPPHTRMRPAIVYDIVSGAMGRAGIARDGRRRGPHALRASVATRMMGSGVPLPVITRTLSHSCSDTSKFYLKADLEQLRRCALDVPPLVNTWWMAGGPR